MWIWFVKWINNIIFLNLAGKYTTDTLIGYKRLYAIRYTCLYFRRFGKLLFILKINELWEYKYVYVYKVPFEFFTEFLTEGSKILHWFVWIFFTEICKEYKRNFYWLLSKVPKFHKNFVYLLKTVNVISKRLCPVRFCGNLDYRFKLT